MSITKTEDAGRLVIQSKGFGVKFEHQFFSEIQAAILDGYRISDGTQRADCSMRNFRGRMGRAILSKGWDAINTPVEVEVPDEVVVEVAVEAPETPVAAVVEEPVVGAEVAEKAPEPAVVETATKPTKKTTKKETKSK